MRDHAIKAMFHDNDANCLLSLLQFSMHPASNPRENYWLVPCIETRFFTNSKCFNLRINGVPQFSFINVNDTEVPGLCYYLIFSRISDNLNTMP